MRFIYIFIEPLHPHHNVCVSSHCVSAQKLQSIKFTYHETWLIELNVHIKQKLEQTSINIQIFMKYTYTFWFASFYPSTMMNFDSMSTKAQERFRGKRQKFSFTQKRHINPVTNIIITKCSYNVTKNQLLLLNIVAEKLYTNFTSSRSCLPINLSFILCIDYWRSNVIGTNQLLKVIWWHGGSIMWPVSLLICNFKWC